MKNILAVFGREGSEALAYTCVVVGLVAGLLRGIFGRRH
jgi:hypothetical protein